MHQNKCLNRPNHLNLLDNSSIDHPIMKPVVCVAAFTLDQKLIVTKRAPNMAFGNAWVLPGGHLEPNETFQSGMSREFFEETGIQIDPENLKPYMVYENVPGGEVKKNQLIIFLMSTLDLSSKDIKFDL